MSSAVPLHVRSLVTTTLSVIVSPQLTASCATPASPPAESAAAAEGASATAPTNTAEQHSANRAETRTFINPPPVSTAGAATTPPAQRSGAAHPHPVPAARHPHPAA